MWLGPVGWPSICCLLLPCPSTTTRVARLLCVFFAPNVPHSELRKTSRSMLGTRRFVVPASCQRLEASMLPSHHRPDSSNIPPPMLLSTTFSRAIEVRAECTRVWIKVERTAVCCASWKSVSRSANFRASALTFFRCYVKKKVFSLTAHSSTVPPVGSTGVPPVPQIRQPVESGGFDSCLHEPGSTPNASRTRNTGWGSMAESCECWVWGLSFGFAACQVDWSSSGRLPTPEHFLPWPMWEDCCRPKVPNSSIPEAHSVLLPEPTHMEDEDERDGEECKVESRRESKQPLRMKHGWHDADKHLSQCHVRHWNVCCETRENVTCEGVLFTLPVGCSRLLPAVNDLTTTIQKSFKIPLWVSWWVSVQNRYACSLMLLIPWAQRSLTFFNLWAPPVFIPLPPWGTGRRRRRMPPSGLIKRNWFRSLFSRFTVETVHICKCFSEVWSEFHRSICSWFVQCDIPNFPISFELLRRWAIGVVFLC